MLISEPKRWFLDKSGSNVDSSGQDEYISSCSNEFSYHIFGDTRHIVIIVVMRQARTPRNCARGKHFPAGKCFKVHHVRTHGACVFKEHLSLKRIKTLNHWQYPF